MKQLNFIKTLSPAQQHALAAWYHISIALMCLLFISIVICQSVQLCISIQLKNDARYWMSKQTSMNQVIDKKNELVQKINALEKRLSILKTASLDTGLPQSFDTYLKALNKTVFLQSLTLRHDHVLCTITCNKPVNAIKFADKLTNSGLFASVKLIQLKTYTQHQTNMVQATIKAERLKS